jgi:hypothetical protein
MTARQSASGTNESRTFVVYQRPAPHQGPRPFPVLRGPALSTHLLPFQNDANGAADIQDDG